MNAVRNESNNAAVFWDFENIRIPTSIELIENLSRFLHSLKHNAIRRVYADWSAQKDKLKKILEINGFNLVNIHNPVKNSVDVQMAVDATEILLTNNAIDAFIIISGDGDYRPAIDNIRAAGKEIIIVCDKASTSADLPKNVDDSHDITQVLADWNDMSFIEEYENRLEEAFRLLAWVTSTHESIGEHPSKSDLLEALKEKKSNFNHLNYGFIDFLYFLIAAKRNSIIELNPDESGTLIISRYSKILDNLNLQILVDNLKEIKDQGWIQSVGVGQTSMSRTLESQLKLPNYTIPIVPDFGSIELKVREIDSKMLMTLFSKSPKLVETTSNQNMLLEYGVYNDELERYNLYQTVSSSMEKEKKWNLSVNRKSGMIEITYQGILVAYQEIDIILELTSTRLPNILLVESEILDNDDTRYYKYSRGRLLTNLNPKNLLSMLERGECIFEWRRHLRKDNRIRDHGSAYRINECDIHKLYDDVLLLF